jgi:virulence-associated protein VapD
MAEFMEFKKDIEDIFQINNGTSKTEAAYVNCNITNAEIFCAKAATFLHNVVLKSTEPLDEQTIALNDQDFVIDVSNTASIDPIANKLYQIALHSQGANIDEQYTTVRIASDSDFNLLNFGLNEMHFYKNNEGKIFFTVPSNSTDADLVYEVDSNMLIENMTFENFVKTSIKHIDHTAEINLHNDEEKLTANANEFIKGYTVAKEDNIEISKYEYNAYTFTEQFEDDFDELPVFVSPSSGAGEQIQIDINNNGHHTYVVNYKGSYIPYDDVAAQTIHFSKPTNPTEVNNYRENIKNRFGQHANFLQDFAIINEVYLGLGFSEEKQNELMLSKSLDSAKKLSFFNTSLYLNDNKIRTFDECGRIVTYELNTIGSGYTKYVRDQNNKIMYKQRFNSNGKTKDLSPSEKQIETMDLLERYNDISKQLEKFGSELLNVDVLLSEQSINSYIDASTNDIGVLTKQLAFIKSKLSETMPEAHVELALKLIKERDANKQNATNKKDLGNIDSHFKDDMEKAVMKNGKIVSSNTASDIYATKLTESITKNETIESAKKFLQLQARVASQFDAKNFGNEKEYADALNAALNKEIQKATNNFIILISKNINLNSENIEGKEKENVILGNALSLANGLVKCANSEFKAEDVKTLKILVGKISKIDEKSKMKKIQPDYDSPYESSKKIKTKLMKKLNADQKGKDVATKDDKTATVNQKSESHDIQIQTQKLTDN